MRVEFQEVEKSYRGSRGPIRAVDKVSWIAESGQILGILGPNGAGKSTMLRLLLGIIKPDGGAILVDGRPLQSIRGYLRSRVGYMPEERGLYPDETVLRQLVYLGCLKGMTRHEAKRSALALLERFGLPQWADAKIASLSKGMAFKIQLAACLIHSPQLVILDEPFYGLDPVNVRLVREMIRSLSKQGCVVLLSTHMMNEVEMLCDRILMMYKGKAVLQGPLKEVQRRYGVCDIIVNPEVEITGIPFVTSIASGDGQQRLILEEGKCLQDLMKALVDNRITITCLQEALTPLEEIFVTVVRQHEERHAKDGRAV